MGRWWSEGEGGRQRSTGVQEYRSTGVQEYRSTGVQGDMDPEPMNGELRTATRIEFEEGF
jgi:hypothetical protein